MRLRRRKIEDIIHNQGIELINLLEYYMIRMLLGQYPSLLNIENHLFLVINIQILFIILKSVIKCIDFDVGTTDMICNCHSSKYAYAPAGHVVTGNLKIVKDCELRKLLKKGLSFREANNINWELIGKYVKKLLKNIKCLGVIGII